MTAGNVPTSETLVKSAFAEFLGCWAAGGEATLSLSAQGGKLTFTTSNSLGRPEAPLHPTPPPPHPAGRRRPNRGPSKRARDNRRAACHQAARASSTPSSPSPSSTSVAPVEEEHLRRHTCRRCGLPCRGHPSPGPGEGRCQVTLDTPSTPPPLENLRSSTPMRDLSSSSTLDHTREEEATPPTDANQLENKGKSDNSIPPNESCPWRHKDEHSDIGSCTCSDWRIKCVTHKNRWKPT